MDCGEEVLEGGNASGAVVRIGDTVRKPWTDTSPRVVAFMAALRERGLDVPEPRGRDALGRLVLEFVPGELAMDRGPLDRELLGRIGRLIRELHDASAGWGMPADAADWPVLLPSPTPPDLICHGDVASWNLVIDGDRLVLIDFDGSGPSTRAWDLAYAAVSFGMLFDGEDPGRAAARLAAFIDGYGADDALRKELPELLGHRAAAMRDLLRRSRAEGTEPWARMHDDGHGEHWTRATAFIAAHRDRWADALSPTP